MLEADEALLAAVEELQRTANQVRQQHLLESKTWRSAAQELQGTVDSLHVQLRDTQELNSQLQASLDAKTAELERAQQIIASLKATCQQKDQTIAKFVSLNQSLRGLLDQQQPEEAPKTMTYDTHELEVQPAKSAPYNFTQQSKLAFSSDNSISSVQAEPVKPTPPPSSQSGSKSSSFIRRAKEEMTYSDFNQMIAELNLYNKHNQTRDETISKVKRLLCPTHQHLYNDFLFMIGAL
jgi:chromosome segregation ATPase